MKSNKQSKRDYKDHNNQVACQHFLEFLVPFLVTFEQLIFASIGTEFPAGRDRDTTYPAMIVRRYTLVVLLRQIDLEHHTDNTYIISFALTRIAWNFQRMSPACFRICNNQRLVFGKSEFRSRYGCYEIISDAKFHITRMRSELEVLDFESFICLPKSCSRLLQLITSIPRLSIEEQSSRKQSQSSPESCAKHQDPP